MVTLVKVSVPNTLFDAFYYLNAGFRLETGMRVLVPFRNATKVGIVIEEIPEPYQHLLDSCNLALANLKNISEVLDETPLLSPIILRLCLWIAQYYQSPLGLVLPLALPKKLRLGQPIKPPKLKSPPKETLDDFPLTLNKEQAFALETISQHLHHFHCFLLQGVTGSGKTEVYLQLITQVLNLKKQVLVLVPEIGLTPQLLARFNARFSLPIVAIHSGLSEGARQTAWQLANSNHAQIVIGTRTAIFTPMPHLGLIIIDEEHDASLKQMEKVRYSARDTALIRAHAANIPIVLGSATPSLESLYNAQKQKYTCLKLNQKAMTTHKLHFKIIDLRNLPMQHGLSDIAVKTIAEHLEKKNQVLVFINRRGFAPVFLCHQCAFIADCPACDSHLTLHATSSCLVCHHCGLTKKPPKQCVRCQSTELIAVGSGTQRIEAHLKTLFPETAILRIDRDEVKGKEQMDNKLAQINNGEAQLIVGTQMLAKGHHFPQLTLVVVVDVDIGFYNQDFRAIEQLGQLLIQVSGRAGRAEHPGQVLIQTHLPQHPLLNLLIQEGYESFSEALLISRKQALLPPYHYLAVVRAQDKQAARVLTCLQHMKKALESHSISIFGPAPAPMPRKAHQHRMQLLLKSSSRQHLQVALSLLRKNFPLGKQSFNVHWNIDVDPIDLS